MKALELQIVGIILDNSRPSPFSDKRKGSVVTELQKVYERWARGRDYKGKTEVKAMYDGVTGMIRGYPPSDYYMRVIDEHGEQFGLAIWVSSGGVQIDIMDKKDVRIALSLGNAIKTQGIKVNYSAREEIHAWGRAYLEASREQGIH